MKEKQARSARRARRGAVSGSARRTGLRAPSPQRGAFTPARALPGLLPGSQPPAEVPRPEAGGL